MHIYRAEDGESFQVNKNLQDIERYENLNNFLHDITGVDEGAVLAYLSDGRRLKDDNLRELAGTLDQAIFVFNRHYLDYELEEVLLRLRVEPLLQDGVVASPENVDKVASRAVKHYGTIMHLASSVRVQHDALRIASTSLDLHVLSISDVFETLATFARRELEKQSLLLNGLEFDLDMIGKIHIHREFLSPSVRRAVEAGEKARTLGDYVSNVKMRQVGEACTRIHNELRKRFGVVEESMARLSAGANDVRSSFVNSGLVYETELCSKRAQEALGQITELKDKTQGRMIDDSELLNELGQLDKLLQDEVQLISDIKNKSTALCIRSLRHISRLNNDLVSSPQMLSNLQADFRVKTNFTHIERLHKMLYAYGATLVEIVRRKEFSRIFSQRAQMIAEVMAKLSSNERKQRQIYRGEVLGQLPFDLKNMDDPVPAMEITSTGTTIGGYSIERTDIMILLEELDKMEQSQVGELGDHINLSPLQETRIRLEKLIMRMDNLETAFDKMAEKSIFSSSRSLLPFRQTTEHTDSEFQELVEQFHDLQDAKAEQERQFEDERHGLQRELDQLQAELRDAHAHAAREGHLVTDLEDQMGQLQHQYEETTAQLRKMETREMQRTAQLEEQRKFIVGLETTRDSQERTIEQLKQELLLSQNEAEQNRKLEAEASSQLMQVLSAKELVSRTLEETLAREKELVEAIESLKERLTRESQENEEKLQAQVFESDRILRDVIAEADGDRGVLEHQCFDLAARVKKLQQECEGFQTKNEALIADISGLQEELQRAGYELEAAHQTEQALRKDLNYAKEDLVSYKVRLDRSEDISKSLLHVATSFRDAHCRAYAAATQSLSSSSKSTSNLAESVALIKPFIEPTPVRPDDVAGALQILSQFDTASLVDAVSKLGSTIRKWQKQCKEYRDRAKGKITFRNFTKGDLALFLPTRNSVSKPWAAFNVSFPHYFLNVNVRLSEQLKTREWIVARITSITEQVVDVRDPSTNPYGLSDGIKFYMIQVEDWTQSNSRRKSSPPPQLGSEVVESHEQAQTGTSFYDNVATLTNVDAETSLPLSSSESRNTNSQVNVTPLSRNLSGNRQQVNLDKQATHDSSSSSSFLARLLVQGTTAVPPIEEVAERSSPSPPRAATPPLPTSLVRRSSSPLARVISRAASPILGAAGAVHPPSPLRSSTSPSPTSLPKSGSPHRRSSSLVRASSPLVPTSRPRPSPILSTPPRSQPSSPLASPAHAHAHVISNSPLSARASLPSPLISSVSLAETSETVPAVNPSVVEPSSVVSRSSSKLGTTAHSGSRRSSSSSKPSVSSLFSAGRSPLTMTAVGSGRAPKAPATTALSNAGPRANSMLIRPPESTQEYSRNLEESAVGMADSIEGSSSSLLDRRRTVSTSSTARNPKSHSRRPSSSNRGAGTGTLHSRAATEQDGEQGSSTGTAGWSFRRKSKRSSGDPEGSNDNASGNSIKRGASDILKRYDDILPQERGNR